MNWNKGFSVVLAAALVGVGMHVIPGVASVKAGDITGKGKLPHLNVAVFHKLHGHEGFVFPKSMPKGDILTVLGGDAQFIFINHTAGLKDGDVVTIASDVLRDDAGEFDDFGVDCSLTVGIKKQSLTVGGMCDLLMLDVDGREIKHKAIVKPSEVPETGEWRLVAYDDEDGIAVYVNGMVGHE